MIGLDAARLRASVGHLFQPLFAIFARGFEVGIKFIFQVVVARMLGSAEAGLFLLALSIGSVVSAAAKFGIDRALVPPIARARQGGENGRALGQTVAALSAILAIAAPVGILVLVAAEPLAHFVFHKPELTTPLRWTAVSIVLLSVLNGIVGALTALGAAAIGDVLRNTLWPALCTVLVLFLSDAAEASAAATISIVVAVVAAWWLLRRLLAAPWPRWREVRLPDRIMAVAAPLWAVDTIDVILSTVPTIVLGMAATNSEVAIFSVANRISLILVAIISAIGNAATPRLALFADANDKMRLGRLMRDAFLLAAAFCLPLALVLLAAPRLVMGLFGPDFADGATVLRILVVGYVFYTAFACTSEVLMMSGHGRSLRRIRFMTLGVCLAMSATAIPLFGAVGAALATAVTMSLSALATGMAVRRQLGLAALPLLAGGMGLTRAAGLTRRHRARGAAQ
jgi:O-antigen/teichoic acid export membrane protein